MGLCPFHSEKTPSFSVNESRRIFKCFGCGKGGNVVHFIMLAENLDYKGALEHLAERANISINYEGGDDRYDEKQKLKNDILSLNVRAQEFFRKNYAVSAEAKAYVAGRRLTKETADKFGIGFAPDGWENLTSYCTAGAVGVPEDLMINAGLALKKEGGRGCYDRFRNRVMFPIFDETGRIVAFGGRPDMPCRGLEVLCFYRFLLIATVTADTVLHFLDLGRRSEECDALFRCRLIDQIDRLVGEIAVVDVADGKLDGGADSRIGDP